MHFGEFSNSSISPSFFASFYNFHNIPYANELQFVKVFPPNFHGPYSQNFFTTKVFYCMVTGYRSNPELNHLHKCILHIKLGPYLD